MYAFRQAVRQDGGRPETGQMRELREVICQRLDVNDILIRGPEPESVPNQDGRIELVEDLLLVGQLFCHPIAERRLAAVSRNAQVKAPEGLVLRRDEDKR